MPKAEVDRKYRQKVETKALDKFSLVSDLSLNEKYSDLSKKEKQAVTDLKEKAEKDN